MISFLEGEIVEKAVRASSSTCRVWGTTCWCRHRRSPRCPRPGRRARIHTRMIVRDDAMLLYGFGSTDERELFDLLTGVTGVGPKVALAFLSSLTPDALRRSVVAGDVGR